MCVMDSAAVLDIVIDPVIVMSFAPLISVPSNVTLSINVLPFVEVTVKCCPGAPVCVID